MWWGGLLALVGIVASLVAHTPAVSAADDCSSTLPTATVERLRGGLTEGSVWGLSADEAAWVLFPVTKDRALPTALQRRLVGDNPGMDVVEIESDHSPFLSRTAELAAALTTLAGRG